MFSPLRIRYKASHRITYVPDNPPISTNGAKPCISQSARIPLNPCISGVEGGGGYYCDIGGV